VKIKRAATHKTTLSPLFHHSLRQLRKNRTLISNLTKAEYRLINSSCKQSNKTFHQTTQSKRYWGKQKKHTTFTIGTAQTRFQFSKL